MNVQLRTITTPLLKNITYRCSTTGIIYRVLKRALLPVGELSLKAACSAAPRADSVAWDSANMFGSSSNSCMIRFRFS